MTRRQRALPLVAPALLCGLALAQIVLAHTVSLSPWKGGGFGMFSTNDHGGFRSLRVFAVEAGERQRLPMPDELRRAALRAREVPTTRRLARLAERLAPHAPEADALHVEVWRLEFDDALAPSLALLAEGGFERTR